MKSSFSVIALVAAIASAAPLAQVVDVVTDTAVVTQYAQVTQWATEGAPAPSATTTTVAAAPSSSDDSHKGANGHGHWSWTHTDSSAAAPTVTSTPSAFSAPPVTTSQAPPPPPPTTSSTSTQAPPPPATTSSPPATSAASGPSGNPSATGDASYQGDLAAVMVAKHNTWRAAFQAGTVTWNQSLVDEANNALAQPQYQCTMDHSNAGQNLGMSYADSGAAADAWGHDYHDYPWNSPDFYENTGHFTQVVWQDSTSIGCAAHDCNGSWNLICNYFPVGNMLGEFAQQVKGQSGTPPT